MNAVANAKYGYSSFSNATRSEQSIEYDIIARVTAELDAASKMQGNDFSAFVKALSNNRRLWILLASDVAHPSNRLPRPLKAQIFYLSQFVEQKSREVLRDRGDVALLIEVNRSLLNGLGQQGAKR
ncbi:MAG: flagellar biosynthesis regulator FlaF [Pseudomonadota bacterium]|nr:flagellar biosynthesis regulator FlaF [Pseudomonadota bacterium]